MGVLITVSGANYTTNNVDQIDFKYLSNGATAVSYNEATKKVSVSCVTPANYEFACTKVRKPTIVKMATNSSVGANGVIIGLDASGNALFLYLSVSSGNISNFKKTGLTSGETNVYAMPSNLPNAPKGTFVTIEHTTTQINISYTGYTGSILYSAIPSLVTKVVGVMATGSNPNIYDFK